MGPLLWLIYVNDLSVENFYCAKYADDITFYKPIRKKPFKNVKRSHFSN